MGQKVNSFNTPKKYIFRHDQNLFDNEIDTWSWFCINQKIYIHLFIKLIKQFLEETKNKQHYCIHCQLVLPWRIFCTDSVQFLCYFGIIPVFSSSLYTENENEVRQFRRNELGCQVNIYLCKFDHYSWQINKMRLDFFIIFHIQAVTSRGHGCSGVLHFITEIPCPSETVVYTWILLTKRRNS